MNEHQMKSDINEFAEQASDTADRVLRKTQRFANEAVDNLSEGVERGQGAFERAASHMDELSRKGVRVAKRASEELSHRVHRAGGRTAEYVHDEPVKAVAIAAAVGAATALVLGSLLRSRRD